MLTTFPHQVLRSTNHVMETSFELQGASANVKMSVCKRFELVSAPGPSPATMFMVFKRNIASSKPLQYAPKSTVSTKEGLEKGSDYSPLQKNISLHKKNLTWISLFLSAHLENTSLQEHIQLCERGT